MSESQANYLDTFPGWLRTLADDATTLSVLLNTESAPEGARQAAAGGLNYLFKSLDLIPDGIEDLGYLDDAFVLRVAADMARRDGLEGLTEEAAADLTTLADESMVVREFLDTNYSRLEGFVAGLRRGAAAGRSVVDILADAEVRDELLSDLHGFAQSYDAPSFAREEKNLIKLRAFFDDKLPR